MTPVELYAAVILLAREAHALAENTDDPESIFLSVALEVATLSPFFAESGVIHAAVERLEEIAALGDPENN